MCRQQVGDLPAKYTLIRLKLEQGTIVREVTHRFIYYYYFKVAWALIFNRPGMLTFNIQSVRI